MTSQESPYHFLETPASATRGNVTAHVTDVLRQAIVTLELKPGEVIDKGALCERLGVSRFPVSEALARLQGEGLVDILPQRGSIVSLVRIADVLEYMVIRKALESEAVRIVVNNNTPELVETLKRNLSYQRAAAEIGDRAGFHQRDLEFHDILFAAMAFTRIKAVIENARANLDRARWLIISPRRLETSLSEHLSIFKAIDAGDAPGAEAAMRAHVDSVMAELLTFARAHPDLFADGERLAAVDDLQSFPFG
ncbi:GntR family transcriptional regulator [Arsenicitalea aurantiaca]|uniref:GntR family transcriptional regulator n=1 Tax=Arsenicitalea aurantiaca TaxID=1783274 RepID=A0A433XK17_9HYPH|nr:GntR family transcriptional regulator [Arsenicitalea aurantiaca]RUT34427.1 GntR family transcriptional regulator [Arsenicitalea aurantiaca]